MSELVKELGRPLAPGANVAGPEGGAQDAYLVLPLARRGAGQPLADAELRTADCAYPPPCFDCIGTGCWERAPTGS